MRTKPREPVLPDTKDTKNYQLLERLLEGLDEHKDSKEKTRLIGPNGEMAQLPSSLYDIILQAVHELAIGNAVAVASIQAVLTTQEAAELLNVSRPFLVGLLEKGEIPFHNVGTHRRVNLKDALDYKQRRSVQRKRVLAEIANDAQSLGLYE